MSANVFKTPLLKETSRLINIVEDNGLSGILLDRCYAVKKNFILKSFKIEIYFIPVQSQHVD